MRFFGSKQRQRKRDGGGQQHHATEAAETRTDVTRNDHHAHARDTGLREQHLGGGPVQQQQHQQPQPNAPKRKGMQGLMKSPTSRSEKDLLSAAAAGVAPDRGGGGGPSRNPSPRSRRRQPDPEKAGYSNLSPQNNNSRAMAQKQQTERRLASSPKPDRRKVAATAAATSPPNRAAAPKVKPASILHKNTNFSPPPPPPPPCDISPIPMYHMNTNGTHAPRVRFMSSGESVASTETSQVHLMAGANSVASSSAMSSNGDRDNVFDRVLHMVKAEEVQRLNAMGMSRIDPKSDVLRHQQQQQQSDTGGTPDRFFKVDAKARAAVAALPHSQSSEDDDLGLLPPQRNDLAPIDIDTGLEIGGSDEMAPIDVDTGLELGEGLGEHHLSPIDTDTGMEIVNDGNNNAVLMNGMKGLKVDSRRARSYDNSSSRGRNQQQPQKHPHSSSPSCHNRTGSDPDKHSEEIPNSMSSPLSAGSWGSNSKGKKSPSGSKSPSNRKGNNGGGGRKAKKFWDKSKDFDTNEWVAFDNKNNNNQGGGGAGGGGSRSPGRVNDLVTF